MKLLHAAPLLALAAAGCFYPPTQKPIAEDKYQLTLVVPFDLAWEAVHTVIADRGLRIIAEDPNNGIIETQDVNGFNLEDADCGQVRMPVKYHAEPDAESSAVYNFSIKPQGNEASIVSVQAVFTAPLHVPLHPISDERCVSRGTEEARLFKEIADQAQKEHRPEFKLPAG